MKTFMILTTLLTAFVSVSSAATVFTMYGDNDCFGLPGPPAACNDGKLWTTDLGGTLGHSYRDASDPLNTDAWAPFEGSLLIFDYTPPATVLWSQLDIKTAGLADNSFGPWDVYFNGTNVGQVWSIGEHADVEVLTYTFVIDPSLLSPSGHDVVSLPTNIPWRGDGYIIDYAELTVSSEAPEPATLLVVCAGLIGVGAARHRFASSRRS
jgi:hypothetical protein